jgi:hypothetical protein
VPISPTTTAIISPPRLLLLHLLSASLSDRVPYTALLHTDIEINGARGNKMKSYNAVSEMIWHTARGSSGKRKKGRIVGFRQRKVVWAL